MYCHGMTRGGILSSSARSVKAGTMPFTRRRMAPRAPTSTATTVRKRWLLTGVESSSTSLTRTTLRPCTSMICWSRRSRFSSRTPSEGENRSHPAPSSTARTVPPADLNASGGSIRSPSAVVTIRYAMRVGWS